MWVAATMYGSHCPLPSHFAHKFCRDYSPGRLDMS